MECFERLAGAALGCMCGDALGMPVEGCSAEDIRREHGVLDTMKSGRLPAGSYTDDSQMMIAIVESLEACEGRFDPADLARRFAQKFQAWRGYGARIAGVMQRIVEGQPWEQVGTDSFGNGGAMRVGVLGAWLADEPSALLGSALDQCRITHHHPRGLAGAAALALAVGLACRSDQGTIRQNDFMTHLAGAVRSIDEHVAGRLEAMPALAGLGFVQALEALSGAYACDVSAAEAVPPAIGAFLWAAQGGGAAREAIILAVNLGGDTDTIGAMAGAAAGAHWGIQSLPQNWIQALENGEDGKDRIIGLCMRLCGQLPIDESPIA